jgi:hypothetical protein
MPMLHCLSGSVGKLLVSNGETQYDDYPKTSRVNWQGP